MPSKRRCSEMFLWSEKIYDGFYFFRIFFESFFGDNVFQEIQSFFGKYTFVV